eukprot:m.73905 g.73905  ORF g.73905 m.73905 type:complete len:836 (+) comp12439_c0_seq2:241-2748(+)
MTSESSRPSRRRNSVKSYSVLHISEEAELNRALRESLKASLASQPSETGVSKKNPEIDTVVQRKKPDNSKQTVVKKEPVKNYKVKETEKHPEILEKKTKATKKSKPEKQAGEKRKVDTDKPKKSKRQSKASENPAKEARRRGTQLAGTFATPAIKIISFLANNSGEQYKFLNIKNKLNFSETYKSSVVAARVTKPQGTKASGKRAPKPKSENMESIDEKVSKRISSVQSSPNQDTKAKRRRISEPEYVASKPVFDLPQAPTFYPTDKEFNDPLAYIASIKHEAEKYGICKIVPPDRWRPRFCQNFSDFKFHTRKQNLHQLYKREGPNEKFIKNLRAHLEKEGMTEFEMPMIGSQTVDLYMFYLLVQQAGGLQALIINDEWGKLGNELKINPGIPNREEKLQTIYYKYLLSYESQNGENGGHTGTLQEDESNTEPFGYTTGKQHTLKSFKRFADEFQKCWFGNKSVLPAIAEEEYWKILERADRHVSVLYGSDIDTAKTGSGFPTDLSDQFSKFGWNLTVLPGLEGSILKHLSGISGISMPWMYVGMLFSTFAWHNEDNYLYSINYHHLGAPKLWYGVSGQEASRFEKVFKQQMPEEFSKRPLLLHDLVTMISPEKLKQGGVNVCTTLQEPRQFVVTFPQAYHSGFSLGFNCGEAVNFASADWIPFGGLADDDYAAQERPVSLDREQLLLNTAQQESDVFTLSIVVAQLTGLRDREERMRGKLEEKFPGIKIIKPRKMDKKQAQKTNKPDPTKNQMMRMRNGPGVGCAPGSYTCSRCHRICCFSWMSASSLRQSERIHCLSCAMELEEESAPELIIRYDLSDLDSIIDKARTKANA